MTTTITRTDIYPPRKPLRFCDLITGEAFQWADDTPSSENVFWRIGPHELIGLVPLSDGVACAIDEDVDSSGYVRRLKVDIQLSVLKPGEDRA